MTALRHVPSSRRVMWAGAALSALVLAATWLCGGSAWRAWMAAAFLAASASAGVLGLTMMVRLIPGAWRGELGPRLEAAIRLTPAALLAGLPVLFTLSAVYGWTHQVQPTGFRAAYFSQGGFIARTAAWWGLLMGLTALLAGRPERARSVPAVGLILYVIVGSVAAVDWLMSLDPDFASSGFGLYVICIQILLALSLCIAVAAPPPGTRPGVAGGVLLTVLMVWAYLAFMQYVIIWSGDLPAGAGWYQRRARGGWDWVMGAVAASRLAPLVLLLMGSIRRDRRWVFGLSLAVALGSVLEVAWLVFPAQGAPASARDLALFGLAVAGMAAFAAGACRPAAASRSRSEPGASP